MSKPSFMDKLLDGVGVEWKALGGGTSNSVSAASRGQKLFKEDVGLHAFIGEVDL